MRTYGSKFESKFQIFRSTATPWPPKEQKESGRHPQKRRERSSRGFPYKFRKEESASVARDYSPSHRADGREDCNFRLPWRSAHRRNQRKSENRSEESLKEAGGFLLLERSLKAENRRSKKELRRHPRRLRRSPVYRE